MTLAELQKQIQRVFDKYESFFNEYILRDLNRDVFALLDNYAETLKHRVADVIFDIINEIEEEGGLVGDDVKRRWIETAEKDVLHLKDFDCIVVDREKLRKLLSDFPKDLRKKHETFELVPLVEFWGFHNQTLRALEKLEKELEQ